MGLLGMRCVLCADAISDCHHETLDLDSTTVLSSKKKARLTDLKRQGYMPLVEHIAETGQFAAA